MKLRSRLSLGGLTALMGGSGVLHLVVPQAYQPIVPTPLAPWSGLVVAISGVGEIACAALLLQPRTRSAGAWATAVLLVAVLPANVQMALNGGYSGAPFPLNTEVGAWLRVGLQAPLIWWALSLRDQPS